MLETRLVWIGMRLWGNCRPSPHVERYGGEQHLRTCLQQTDVTDAGQSHAAFEGSKGGLHSRPSSRDEEVIAFEPGWQVWMMLVGPAGNARLFAFRFEPSPSCMGVISRIGPHHRFIAADQFVGGRGVVDIRRRRHYRTDQTGSLIDTHMRLIAEGPTTLALPLGKAGVGIV